MKGIGVSPGIAIGRAFVIKKDQTALTGIVLNNDAEISAEIERFDKAVDSAIAEVEEIKANAQLNFTGDDLAILETQIEFLSDPQLKEDVIQKINEEKKNANDALIEVIGSLVEVFQNMDDEYMRARSADIQDIGSRILRHLNVTDKVAQIFEQDTIIIAEDIAPSDTITLDINLIAGFATQMGSKTSHAAIIAKSKGIPAVAGCGGDLRAIKDNDVIILDGISGMLYVNPDLTEIDEYKEKRKAFIEQAQILKALKDKPAITTDGTKIKLTANISGAEDWDRVFANGGEGVGLLRTEMLFMNRNTFPSEQDQFEFYKQVAIRSKGKSVIVRTIDIGGDKQLPYFGLPPEQNPFLGYRAIRICLDRTDIFITQLRAILRASEFGDLKIMLPMISNVEEVRTAISILNEAKAELFRDDISFKADIDIGIMIEIPSAAVMADMLAKEVDFFSIGTNDLCQYTLAVDRMNEKIGHLYDPFNPGVLRLIANVIEQGKNQGIHVGMCGEMAGDPLATLLLLGMGLEEFSMSASSIPQVKAIIINHKRSSAQEIWQKVKQMDNSSDIITYLQEFTA